MTEIVSRNLIDPEDVIAWLITQPNANGTLFLENVVRTYMSALRNAPQRLILKNTENGNVFNCHTVAELDQHRAVLKASPNYIEVNRAPWRGQLSAGLAVFKRYLEHLEKDVSNDNDISEVSREGETVSQDTSVELQSPEYSRVDFNHPELCTQTRPISCVINNETIMLCEYGWAQLLISITEHFIKNNHPKLASLVYKPLCGRKPFFLPSKEPIATCALLSNGKWIYTNYNAQTIVINIKNLCIHCGVSLEDVIITFESSSRSSMQLTQRSGGSTCSVPNDPPGNELNPMITEILSGLLTLHFSNGYRLNSPIEMARFRSFAKEDFGEELAFSNNGLESYIAACGTTYEGKVYAVSTEAKDRIRELVEEYLANGAQVIFFTEFYAQNESWLFGDSIVSEEMLIEILRGLFPKLVFTQTYFGYTDVSVFSVLESEILRVWDGDVLLTYDQLSERLSYVPLDRIKYALGQNGDFVWNSVETFTHISRFKIADEEREAIRAAAIQNCDTRGYTSFADLPLGEIEDRNCKLSITAIHGAIFRICLSDRFDKKGKIVTRKGDIFDALSIIQEHCRNIDHCSLDDLLNIEKELTGEIHRWAPMEAGNTILVRIDKDTYVSDRYVHFEVDMIDEAIGRYVTGNYLPSKAFTAFGAFPDCGQIWNLFLLESYCRRFSTAFRFDTPSVNSRNAGTIIRKSCGMDYTEIMTDAVVKANIPLRDIDVGRFLYENGYTGRSTTSKADEIIEQALRLR